MIFHFRTLLVMLFSWSSFLYAVDSESTVDDIVAKIDIDQWYQDTVHLTSYNRFYQSGDIERARDWLQESFQNLGLETRLENISIGGFVGHNVIAEIKGNKADEIYIIGAHYDATSEDPLDAAPGAEDNASGTAGLLTIARAFAHLSTDATIRFVAFSGEEEGLYGSEQHVDNLLARGEEEKIRGVLIMDMIGFSHDDDLDVLIETDERNQSLVDLLSASAEKYTDGRIETSYSYWGSDHVPFIHNGFLAALLIENDYDEYPDYHRSTDVAENLNPKMAEVILKAAAGVLGGWVL